MINRFGGRRWGLMASAAGFVVALGAAPAAAQDSPVSGQQGPASEEVGEDDAGAPVDSDGEEVVVTGFRRSLENAVAEKKNRDQIVESVSAEDIGKLPDASIAESIARLPGLAAQRINGRANIISVRGFGPDFSQTLLNGREQTSTGDNRAVEFDQYPSEVVSQVVVYKSPIASLVGQGLVGTVDIRTIRPLNYGGRQVLAVGARGVYADIGALNAGSKDTGYRLNATYVDQFADDTIGVSIAASYVDEPYQVEEFNAWGYANAEADGIPGIPDGNYALIGGSKSYVTSTQLTRLGLQATGQWRPVPELTFTLDGFYSDFDDEQIKRGIELPLGFGAFGTTTDPLTDQFTVNDDQVTSGTFRNVQGVVRNDAADRKAELISGGFNALYESDSGLNAFFDFGYSRTDRNELIFESYSGTGYNVDRGATDTISFVSRRSGTKFDPTLNYSDPNLILLTDPLGWGGSRVQAGYYNNRIVDDELMQYRAQVEQELETSFLKAVKVGANYTDRDKTLTPDEAFIAIASGAPEQAIPSQFLLRPTNLAYLGLGPIVSYDPRALLREGVYRLDANAVQDVFAKSYGISEKLITLYAQADLEAEFGTTLLTGNVGVQAIRTDQESTGFVFAPGGPEAITLGDDFWDVLPSANLSFRFENDFVIRAAFSKQMQRPRLDDLRVAIGYGVNRDGPVPIIRGSGGNPTLQPYRATAYDLNFEKYFGNTGYVALQIFYKKLDNFIYQNVERPFDFTDFSFADGALDDVPSLIGTVSGPENVGGGKLFGLEFASTINFGTIVSALDGFGFTGGLGYTETKVRQEEGGERTQIPGYSKWVANGTVFYEKAGFNIRGSARHRSSFLGELSIFGGARGNRRALGETIIDGQIGYDFQETSALRGLSLFIQGQNLTDEPFVTVTNPDTPLQVIDHQSYGRRFLAGATFKF